MSNSLLTDSMITKEILMALKNKLGMAGRVNRQLEDKFGQDGAKKGATVNFRKPTRYSVTDGATLAIQDSADQYVALTVDKQKHVGMAFSEKDRVLSIDDFRKRYIDNAVIPLANQVDQDVAALYKSVTSFTGVPSETVFPSTLKGFTQAKALLAKNGAPTNPLFASLGPDAEASMVDGLKGLFQSSSDIAKQYKEGTMGYAAGMEFFMSQNAPMHLSGAPVGTPAIDTDSTTTTLQMDGITGSITACYKEGDVIQIAGVYAVNPVTKATLNNLKCFVVTATTDSVSNEIAALPISPTIVTSGAYQNVSAAPVDGAAVTLFGAATTYANKNVQQNLVFHEDAFALAMVELELPNGVHIAARASDKESGLSVRMVSAYNIGVDRIETRLDVLYGVKCIYEELACRVVGQPA